MTVPVRRERRKQPLRRSITSALELYLGDMNGHEVNDLYYVVMQEVEPAILPMVNGQEDTGLAREAELNPYPHISRHRCW